MAFIATPSRPDVRVLPVLRAGFARIALGAAALALTAACSDLADPRDYGGGAEGQVFAQCVTRTEKDNPDITREQAASLCTCLNERIAEGTEQPISDGSVDRAENQRALLRCAEDLGIEAS
ncbi:hypothetical protein [Erythrobacter sp.]|jgi:hypothetical protein|uniref:hypothetical protein n=1 Tax=Erythrobacter sp. TaxID=1042 RepID=UPI002EC015D7|nr:hypothetical protein [Erythrobacter sp.]